MPTPTKYTFSLATDFGGAINTATLVDEIHANATITTDLDNNRVDTNGDVVDIWFKDVLAAAEETELYGDVSPPGAGSVLANHNSAATTPPAESVNIANSPDVHVRKPSGLNAGRVYGFSVNFCDKTTWYHNSTKVTDEAVGTGDGAQTVFALDHGTDAVADEAIVCLSHGKLSEENNLANPDGDFREMGNGYGTTYAAKLSGYVPVIKIDGVEQSERAYGETTGGDYEINYTTGALTFYTAPANTLAITATYYYVPANEGPCVLVVPGAGKRYMIDRVEIQSSPDAAPKCDIIMGVYAGAAPPSGTLVERPTVIKNIYDIVNWAYGSRPQVETHAGAEARGLNHLINIHQVRYASEIPLLSSSLMYMQVHLDQAVPFAGTWATIVIYGIEEDEPT